MNAPLCHTVQDGSCVTLISETCCTVELIICRAAPLYSILLYVTPSAVILGSWLLGVTQMDVMAPMIVFIGVPVSGDLSAD